MSEETREVVDLPTMGDAAFGALMDALAPEEGTAEWEQRLLLQIRLQQRMLLLEALTPMAEALQRLDNLQRTATQQLDKRLQYQEELLMEVLNSLQPPAQEQIFPQIGPQTPRASFPSSVS